MHCFILIDRKTARSRGMKYYFTGRVCARGSVWIRRVSTANCVCKKCKEVKNKGNNKHYHSVKNNPEFKEKIRKATRDRREWKRQYDKEYRERTREKQNEWSRKWVRENRDKRRAVCQNYSARRRSKEAVGVSSSELAKWKSEQIKKCYWCGASCDDSFHVDHYVPLARGGKHDLGNLVISCGPCNLRKNAKDPYEFAQEVGRLF